MKKLLFIFLLIFINSFASEVIIKSLQVYSGRDQASFPLIRLRSNQKINIEFDVDSEESPNLSIHFWFCDKDWNPYYNNLFLQPQVDNSENNIWLDHIKSVDFTAAYHYSGSFPNDYVSFPHSGKWMFFITDSYDEEKIYASGKFFVIDNSISIEADMRKLSINKHSAKKNKAFDRSLEISAEFYLPDSLSPFRIEEVEIIENRKFDYSKKITKDISTLNSYEWDGANKFKFISRDFSPGNNYRQVNLMNANRHYPPETYAKLAGPETSNFYHLNRRDFFGASRIVKYENSEALYMDVNFELRLDDKYPRPVFIVGAFNNWMVLPEYELFEQDGLHTITLQLKRGIYDYQYVYGNIYDYEVENIDWLSLEGNEYNASKEYYIFLYYKSDKLGEYDKIIGFTKILSKNYD